jgi:CRP/FNR family transcriptional regulator
MESAIQQSCLNCTLRPDRLFCDLPSSVLQALDTMKAARGVFILCEGRAKLSVCSESGKRLILRIAVPGEVLGLSATLTGTAHEVTAELLDNARVVLVKRKDLLRFLREHREACLHVVTLLSQNLHVAYDRVRSVGLGRARRSRPAHA